MPKLQGKAGEEDLPKVLASRWFTHGSTSIGVVLVKVHPNGWKSYIGAIVDAGDKDNDKDSGWIMQNGARFDEMATRMLFMGLFPKGLIYQP